MSTQRLKLREFFDEMTVLDTFRQLHPTVDEVEIVAAKTTDKAAAVLKLLQERNFLAMPVFDSKSETWVGFIDNQDFVRYAFSDLESYMDENMLSAIKSLKEPQMKSDKKKKEFPLFSPNAINALKSRLGDLHQLIEASMIKKQATVADVMKRSSRNAWCPISWQTTIRKVLELFNTRRVRRLPITSNNGQIQSLLTPSDLMVFFHKNLEHFGDFKSTSISELTHLSMAVRSVPLDATALDGFHQINIFGISSVAVVNESQELVGSIRVHDLSDIDGTTVKSRLFLPVKQYLESEKKSGTCTISNSGTFAGILSVLNTKVARQVFILEGTTKKIWGVVSQIDVLDEVSDFLRDKEPKWDFKVVNQELKRKTFALEQNIAAKRSQRVLTVVSKKDFGHVCNTFERSASKFQLSVVANTDFKDNLSKDGGTKKLVKVYSLSNEEVARILFNYDQSFLTLFPINVVISQSMDGCTVLQTVRPARLFTGFFNGNTISDLAKQLEDHLVGLLKAASI